MQEVEISQYEEVKSMVNANRHLHRREVRVTQQHPSKPKYAHKRTAVKELRQAH